MISIFVNEKQFNSKQDFEKYPSNKGKDYDFCDQHNVDVIFEPSVDEIYKHNEKSLENKYFQNILCDHHRPGHFDGVITVLQKLFSIVDAHNVYFGQKDFQQLKIVEKFIEESFPKLKLKSVPTARQEEGIAFSSRNKNLSKKQIQDFSSFHESVIHFIKNIDIKTSISEANTMAKNFINNQSIEKFDYLEFRNSSTLDFEGDFSKTRLFYAIYIGQTRLIDNIEV